VPEPRAFEVEVAVGKLKRYKLSGVDQVSAEFIKAGGRKICFEIHKLISPIQKEEDLPQLQKESVILPSYKKDDGTCSNYQGISF
jgi:hypothetical protein